MIEVAVRLRQGEFLLDAAFSASGGVTALFGPSGAGKSTLLDVIAGLRRPEAARIAVAGERLADLDAGLWPPPRRRRIGYVFQDARLFPHLSVRRNLLYGAPGIGRLAEVAALLGLEAMLHRRPATLSGGERQRVAIGRALLSEPRLLLMDEPLAAVDGVRRSEILPYIERLRDVVRLPILYVSHNEAEVEQLADAVVHLSNGRVQTVRRSPRLHSAALQP